MSFRIGQGVVCIKDHSQGVIKKGQTFVIKGKKEYGCGCIGYDLGIRTIKKMCNCGVHGITSDSSGVHWISPRILAPLDDNFADNVLENIKEQIKEEQYEKIGV